MEGWLGKRPSLQKDYGAWTNHESSGTISFELMRLRWRFGLRAQHYVCLPKTKRSTSPQKPHTNCQAWWLVGGNVLTIHHWKHLLEISSIRITAVYLQSFFPPCTLSHLWWFANVFIFDLGEMQGTVHRRLLEEKRGELKTGAVLLLKQVIYRCLHHTALPAMWSLEFLRNRRDALA